MADFYWYLVHAISECEMKMLGAQQSHNFCFNSQCVAMWQVVCNKKKMVVSIFLSVTTRAVSYNESYINSYYPNIVLVKLLKAGKILRIKC